MAEKCEGCGRPLPEPEREPLVDNRVEILLPQPGDDQPVRVLFTCPDCLHPGWAHRKMSEDRDCIGERCRCRRVQAVKVRP